MRRLIFLAIVAITIAAGAPPVASAQSAGAGPFGLRKGMTLSEVEKFAGPLKADPPGIYKATRVPRPDPGLESYGLVIAPKIGLCAILGVGQTLQTDATGVQVQKAFLARKDSLAKVYGDPLRVSDYLRPKSKLGGPQDWMTALMRQERILAAFWSVTRDPGSVSSIQVEATGLNPTHGYLKVIVGFDNGDACIAELKALRTKK